MAHLNLPASSTTEGHPTCYYCLRIVTDNRDVPVRDEDALIAVICRMSSFPGSRLVSRPPMGARLCRPCYDNLKRIKTIISQNLLDRIRVLVYPFWSGPEPMRPSSPPLCPAYNEFDLHPNIRRRHLRSMNIDRLLEVESTLIHYTQLSYELHSRIFQQQQAAAIYPAGFTLYFNQPSTPLQYALSQPIVAIQRRQQEDQQSVRMPSTQIIDTHSIPFGRSTSNIPGQQHTAITSSLSQNQSVVPQMNNSIGDHADHEHADHEQRRNANRNAPD
uniref:Uncharacterized protein n=1 Tax=Aureoumbra lagunensis TaxID=44058 RepID=A0A7S3JZT4_9STRA|mmetsp:Transcript_7651/g.10644  ORF Transcript_7651/g.10644 Transcript_7651/m.10644 type:complete len:274 (+) Transcript_7651:244-1065(+)